MIDELLKLMALVLMVEAVYLVIQILQLCQEVLPILPRIRRLLELAMNDYDVRQSTLDLWKKKREMRGLLRQAKQSPDCRSTEAKLNE